MVEVLSKISGARVVERCDRLGVQPFSDIKTGLFRAYLTPAHAATINTMVSWMSEAGMSTRLDAAANLIGRYEGNRPNAPALIIGSHVDSVFNAGRYDGPLGVMLGIECVEALHEQGRRLPFAIEVVAFGDEEGSRFPISMICSRAMAGTLTEQDLAVEDSAGRTPREVLQVFREWMYRPMSNIDPMTAAREPRDVLAYLETHIEQGPVLEAEGLSVGAVTGIAAQNRFDIVVKGMAAHAGTTTMQLRRDAMAGAAEMIMAIETIANEMGGDLVATVGRIELSPGSTNVIAKEVSFSLDVRSGGMNHRDTAAAAISEEMHKIAVRRGLKLELTKLQDLASSPCDKELTDLLETAMERAGHPRRALVSGAGHDAMVMSALCPTAMLFVRCAGGISHNPAEQVSIPDTQAALDVMLEFIDLLEARET
ncbi:MAG: allantoate amidohydrolase [Henriciella sp.]|nr:allantoate amidohydrolase [Henriciella sp.]